MAPSQSITSDRRGPPAFGVDKHTSESDANPSSDSDERSILESPENTRPLQRADGQSSSSASPPLRVKKGQHGVTYTLPPRKQTSLPSPSTQGVGPNRASLVAPRSSLTLRRAYNSDGRVRDPTPIKFQGRPNDHGGNFMVVNFLLDKKVNSEADAKMTSERTAAVAAAANAKGYSSIKRRVWEVSEDGAAPTTNVPASSRPHIAPAPTSSQTGSWQAWTSPPPQHEQRQTPEHTLKRKRGRPKKTYPVLVPSYGTPPIPPFPQPYPAHHEGVNHQQDYRAPEGSQPYAFTPQQPDPSHASPGASPSLNSHGTKVEQARLLTLLRSINPTTVVDNLCKGIAYFGGIPGAPPPATGFFPTSARNGSGHELISWVAELFPDGDQCPAYGKGKDYPPPVIPHVAHQSNVPERFPSPDQLSAPSHLPMQMPPTTAAKPHITRGVAPLRSSSSVLKVPKKRGRPWGSKSSVFRSDKGKKRGPSKKKLHEESTSANTRLVQGTEAAGQNSAVTVPPSSEWQPTEPASPLDPMPFSEHPNAQRKGADAPKHINNHKNAAPVPDQQSSPASSSPIKSKMSNPASASPSQRTADIHRAPKSSSSLTNSRAPSTHTAYMRHTPPLGAVSTNAYAQSPPGSSARLPSSPSRSPAAAQAPLLSGTEAPTPFRSAPPPYSKHQ